MASPLEQVADGYARLATTLVDRWSTYASQVAGKWDAGRYGPEDAMADAAAYGFLVTESLLLVATEGLDAVAILSGRQDQPHMVDSDVFSIGRPGAELALAGPLVGGWGTDALPVDAVEIVPASAGRGLTAFTLRADATGHKGDTYVGTVIARVRGAEEPIDVQITVP